MPERNIELDVDWSKRVSHIELEPHERDELTRFNAYQEAMDALYAPKPVAEAPVSAAAPNDSVAHVERVGFSDREQEFNEFGGITPGGVVF